MPKHASKANSKHENKSENNQTAEQLKKETEKWLKRLEKEIKGIKSTGRLKDEHVKSVLTNMNAYISDCRYFMKKNDWVHAFEAVIYAWGIYESCAHLKLIHKK